MGIYNNSGILFFILFTLFGISPSWKAFGLQKNTTQTLPPESVASEGIEKIKAKLEAQVKKYMDAIGDTHYYHEASSPWYPFYSKTKVSAVSPEVLRQSLRPYLEKIYKDICKNMYSDMPDFKGRSICDIEEWIYPPKIIGVKGHEYVIDVFFGSIDYLSDGMSPDLPAYTRLKEAFLEDFSKLYLVQVCHPLNCDMGWGVEVVLLVGRTPEGYLVGLETRNSGH